MLGVLAACGERASSHDCGASAVLAPDGDAPIPADAEPAGDLGGSACEVTRVKIPYRARTPDLMLVFDRSPSMTIAFGSGTRFTKERDILLPLIATSQDDVRWGYQEFPSKTVEAKGGVFCCVGAIAVAPALNSGDVISARIERALEGVATYTPTALALRTAREHFAGSAATAAAHRYVLLSTDGHPNCGINRRRSSEACRGSVCSGPCTDAVAEIEGLAALGVKTIVLGIQAAEFGSCLERMAMAGGAARSGPGPAYYPADTPERLETYLREIVIAVATPSCDIVPVSPPPNPGLVALSLDGQQIPRDETHVNGWDFSSLGASSTIRVYGLPCLQLQYREVGIIEILYGCPPCRGTALCDEAKSG